MNYDIERNGLHFALTADGYICKELKSLPELFAQKWGEQEVRGAIKERILAIRSAHAKRYLTQEERDSVSEEERIRLGGEIFDEIVPAIRLGVATKKMTLMDEFLFWLGYWWYYHPQLRVSLTSISDRSRERIYTSVSAWVEKFLLPLLPEPVQCLIKERGYQPSNVAVGYGHFAILFTDRKDGPRDRRRIIVTDRQLFELHDVAGYFYLDIQENGKPVARCCCPRGGERAFFDGVRLMAHEQFETCAPKTVIVDGGYKVNSTRCTIVNGMLFPLIDVDDAVAQTTGAFFGMVDFSNKEAVESYEMSERSGGRMCVRNGKVFMDGKEIKPIGFFEPSKLSLQSSGFTLYDWSEYQELPNFIYQHVLVVDDKQIWIDQVQEALAGQIERVEAFCTTDKHAALAKVLELKPQALLLDVHLTQDEQFDGLWIANQLAKQKFSGLVLLCSSYRDEALRAMRALVCGNNVAAPGKNLERIKAMLMGKK